MFERIVPSRRARRRWAGWTWTLAWSACLYAFATPWSAGPDEIDERIRWAGGAGRVVALTAGFALGSAVRRSSSETGRKAHRDLVERVQLPFAALGLLVVALLDARQRPDAAWAVLQAALGFAAGCDLGFGAVPLLDGEPYAFARPLPPPEPGVVDPPDRTGSDAELL